jgi:WD40 repeat protein
MFDFSIEVTRIKFANDNKDLIAFASNDGTISICDAFFKPDLKRSLKGHIGPVTGKKSYTSTYFFPYLPYWTLVVFSDVMYSDFDWSMTNDFIVSTSVDRTIRIWTVNNGVCMRKIIEDSIPLCCLFYPINNNVFFISFEREESLQFLYRIRT